MPTALELRDQRARIWERMKEVADTAEAENRDLSAEEKASWDQAEKDIEALDARIERQAQLERRPAPESPTKDDPTPREIAMAHATGQRPSTVRATPEYKAAFDGWLRHGMMDLDRESRSLLLGGYSPFSEAETRALAVSTATAGGYFVPDEFQRSIEQALLDYGGMREVATVISTDSGADLALPTSNNTGQVGRIIGENTQAQETDPTIGQIVLKAYMYSSDIVRVPYTLLQDSAFDVEAWLTARLVERIGRITNQHFTTGLGPSQPTGIVNDAVVGRTGAAGQTTTITWDDLILLEHAVDPAYRRGARFMMSDTTLRDLRRLKDGEGRYLWQPGTTMGAPNTIDGYPYTVNQDVADMAASARSVVFGQMTKYIIRDVRGFQLLRLEERYADFLQVGFLGFSRHDGKLIDAGTNPVQVYSNPAS